MCRQMPMDMAGAPKRMLVVSGREVRRSRLRRLQCRVICHRICPLYLQTTPLKPSCTLLQHVALKFCLSSVYSCEILETLENMLGDHR
mmetsp:Transcript_78050/g.187150  ORF Transcript_78050/g.187150 Transcript_78050/m.187150 type:complete len:88 (-) Transcript_78050:41-304(-)